MSRVRDFDLNISEPDVEGRGHDFDLNISKPDDELDTLEVVEPDSDPPEEMGDPSVEVNEDNRKAAEVSKWKALNAVCEGKLVDAKDYLTRAIVLNPKSALLFASRAGIFVKLKKPNAAIRDADAALQLNHGLVRGYKARGMAKAMLGLWEEALEDLYLTLKLDFDEENLMILQKVCPIVEKIIAEREQRSAELERQRMDAEAQSVLSNGAVIQVHSSGELKIKLNAASRLSRIAVVYFYATWGGACKYMSEVYARYAREYPTVVFLTIDIEEVSDVAAQWEVDSIPYFVFMKNGERVDKTSTVNEVSLKKKIDNAVKSL